MFWKKQPLGIDIGTRTLRGISLKKVGNKLALVDAFLFDLSIETEQFPIHVNTPSLLKAAVETRNWQKQKTSVNISYKDVFTSEVSLPDIPAKELRSAIISKLEAQWPVAAEEMSLDFISKKAAESVAANENSYLVYASRKQTVLELSQNIQSANLQVISVEPDIIATTAMLAYNQYTEPTKDYIVVEIGESHVDLGFISGSNIQFSTTLPKGLGDINQVLFQKLHISYQDAENLKRKYDMGDPSQQPTPEQEMIDDFFFELFYRIQRIIDFYKLKLKGRAIAQILLCGGGSQIINIKNAFEDFCETECVIVNPFRNIELYGTKKSQSDENYADIAPYFSTAVGLAVRGHNGH